jgi:hypothetical protein
MPLPFDYDPVRSYNFTPTLSAVTSAPTVTYSAQVGTLDFIGRLCVVNVRLALATLSGGSGLAYIPLPFKAARRTARYHGACRWGGFTLPAGYTQVNAVVVFDTDRIIFSRSGSGLSTASVDIGELGGTATIALSIMVLA